MVMVPVSVTVMRPVRKAKRQHASLKTCFEKNEGQIRKDDELSELNPVPVPSPAPAPAPAGKTALTEIEGKTGMKEVSSSTVGLSSPLSPKKIIEDSSSTPCILNLYNSDSKSKSKSSHEQESYCHCLICFKSFPNLSEEGILDASDFEEYERMFGIVSKLLLKVNVNSDSCENNSLDTQRQIQSSSLEDEDENSFNFLIDPFPFCSTCQDLVVNLCLLQEDFESIREEIRVSVQDLTSMIINSSTALTSTQDNQNQQELKNDKNSVIIHFDEKINYYRKAAVEKYRRIEPGSESKNEEETTHLSNIPAAISEEENAQEYKQDTHHNPHIIISTASQDSAGAMNGELEMDANTVQPDANANTGENCSKRKRKMTKTTPPHSKPKALGAIKIPRKVEESLNGIFLYEGFQFRSVGDILYECCTCDIRLKKRAMQTHIIYSHREREKYPFSCSTCAMGFETEELLQGHLKTHRSRNNLEKIKVDSEQEEAPFSLEIRTEYCHSCNKKFATKQDLRRHSVSHSGGVSYDCSHPNCGKSYMYHNGFQTHLKTHHDVATAEKTPKLKQEIGQGTPSPSPRQRPVYWKKCKLCGKKFAFKAAFTIHVQQAHKDVTMREKHMEMSNSTENEIIISVSDSDEDSTNDPNNDDGKSADKNEGVPPVQSASAHQSVSNVVDLETNNTTGEAQSGMCPSPTSTEYITLTVNNSNDSNESDGAEDGGQTTHLSSGNIQFHRVVLSADPVLLHHHHSSLQETELPLLTSMPSAGNFLEVVREDPNGVHTTEIVQIVQIL